MATGYFEPKEYTMATFKTDVNVDFTDDTWHQVTEITVPGAPIYFWSEFYNGNWEIRFTLDGDVIFQMTDQETARYDLSDRNQVAYRGTAPYRRANDIFSWHFPDIQFDSSFKIEVRRRSGNGHGIDRALFLYRKEKI